MALCDVFDEKLVKRGERVRLEKKHKAEKNKELPQPVTGEHSLYCLVSDVVTASWR